MDEAIPQDVKETRNNNQCTEDGEGYQEANRRDKYNVDRGGKNHPSCKYQ